MPNATTNGSPFAITDEDHVVVVLGAGASISEMIGSGQKGELPPTDASFLRVSEKCCHQHYQTIEAAFDDVWGGYEPCPMKWQRMEQLFASTYLRYLRSDTRTKEGRRVRDLLDGLVILLRDTLTATTDLVKPKEHIHLLTEIASHNPSSMTVLSFNYDVLADRAVRYGNAKRSWKWNYADGYGFTPSNCRKRRDPSSLLLLKLHGSMNWYLRVPKGRESAQYREGAGIYIPKPSSKGGGAVWQRRQRKATIDDESTKIFPLLVPPVYEKGQQIHGRIQSIWDEAQRRLDRATLLVVWGYSFPITDYHVEVLFASAARRSKPRLLVVNPDPAALGRVTYVCGHQWSRWFFRMGHLLEHCVNVQAV